MSTSFETMRSALVDEVQAVIDIMGEVGLGMFDVGIEVSCSGGKAIKVQYYVVSFGATDNFSRVPGTSLQDAAHEVAHRYHVKKRTTALPLITDQSQKEQYDQQPERPADPAQDDPLPF